MTPLSEPQPAALLGCFMTPFGAYFSAYDLVHPVGTLPSTRASSCAYARLCGWLDAPAFGVLEEGSGYGQKGRFDHFMGSMEFLDNYPLRGRCLLDAPNDP